MILETNFKLIKEKFSNSLNNYNILTDDNNNPINPIVWYKFDKDDLNKNEINSVNKLSYNNGTVSDDFIKGNGSLYLSDNTHAEIPVSAINFNSVNNLNGITFTFWAKLNSKSGNSAKIFDFGMNTINNPLQASRSIFIGKFENTNNLIFGISNADSSSSRLGNIISWNTNNYNYFDNEWRYYTWTISNKGIWNIYINNFKVLKDFYGGKIESFNINNQFNYLGKSLNLSDGKFHGNIDDFRIYNRELTSYQLIELFTGNKPIGEEIIVTGECANNNMPTGLIKQIPNTNIGIKSFSGIRQINNSPDIYEQTFTNKNDEFFVLKFSKHYSENFSPVKLFNKNNFNDFLSFNLRNYDNVTGNYIGNISFKNIVERGDFIRITLPYKIVLKRYGFKIPKNWISRAPGTWSIYAKDDNNKRFVQLYSNSNRLTTANYCEKNLYTFTHDINKNVFESNDYTFIFTSLAKGDNSDIGNVLCLSELLLFTNS